MKRLFGLVILTAVGSISATAQSATVQQPAPAAASQSNPPAPKQPFAATIGADRIIVFDSDKLEDVLKRMLTLDGFRVFNDNGRIYVAFTLGGGVMVPMVGGGASGCWSDNLPERIDKLKRYIEMLPPPKR